MDRQGAGNYAAELPHRGLASPGMDPSGDYSDAPVGLLEPVENEPRRWEALLAIEGEPTIDGRFFPIDSLSWRDLPLTLLAQLQTADGHDEAVVCGRMDEVWKVPQENGTVHVMGRGVFDSGDQGQEIARMVEERTVRGLSIDVATSGAELRDPETGLAVDMDDVDPFDVLMSGKYQTQFTSGKIGAATIVAFPAFDDANIAVVSSAHYKIRVPSLSWPKRLGMTASAAGLVPLHPPSSWFDNPELNGPTPLTITDEGQVYGYLATWDVCHIGMPNGCRTAPKSRSDYAFFHLGEVATAEGDRIAVGKITLDTGHAPLSHGKGATLRHYDDTGTVAADVRAGEDDIGIWVAGALRPDMPAISVRRLAASAISGDWRSINGNLELVAALAVNVPGFPIPRALAVVAGGGEETEEMPLALVAAGHACGCDSTMTLDEFATRIGALAEYVGV